jgi:hypothetical protein
VGFNLKPDAEFILRLPNGDHSGAGIAGDHSVSLSGDWFRPRR